MGKFTPEGLGSSHQSVFRIWCWSENKEAKSCSWPYVWNFGWVLSSVSVFLPAACYICLDYNLQGGRGYQEFVRNVAEHGRLRISAEDFRNCKAVGLC